jgi:hypothetical protein
MALACAPKHSQTCMTDLPVTFSSPELLDFARSVWTSLLLRLARNKGCRAPAPADVIVPSSFAHAATISSATGSQGGDLKGGEASPQPHDTKSILVNALQSIKVLFVGCTKCGRPSTKCSCPSGKHSTSCSGMSCRLAPILTGSVFTGRKSACWPLWSGHQRRLTANFCREWSKQPRDKNIPCGLACGCRLAY